MLEGDESLSSRRFVVWHPRVYYLLFWELFSHFSKTDLTSPTLHFKQRAISGKRFPSLSHDFMLLSKISKRVCQLPEHHIWLRSQRRWDSMCLFLNAFQSDISRKTWMRNSSRLVKPCVPYHERQSKVVFLGLFGVEKRTTGLNESFAVGFYSGVDLSVKTIL